MLKEGLQNIVPPDIKVCTGRRSRWGTKYDT
jgi:hypothetical protein